jgi:hypothetical protein
MLFCFSFLPAKRFFYPLLASPKNFWYVVIDPLCPIQLYFPSPVNSSSFPIDPLYNHIAMGFLVQLSGVRSLGRHSLCR